MTTRNNEKFYEVLYLETNEIHLWNMQDILYEINRDRSAEWTDYDETDFEEGWSAWVEGEFYSLLMLHEKS